MRAFPFLSLRQCLVILRVSVAVMFLAHAIVRLFTHDSIASFSAYLDGKGFPFATAIVWVITIFEIAGGLLLLLGFFVKCLSAGFIALLIAGIIIIHANLGWFVGEHGTGGCEYSVVLIVALLVIAAAGEGRYKEADQ